MTLRPRHARGVTWQAWRMLLAQWQAKGSQRVMPRVPEHGTLASIYARHAEAQQANDCSTTPTAIICTAKQQSCAVTAQKLPTIMCSDCTTATKNCLSSRDLLQASIGSVSGHKPCFACVQQLKAAARGPLQLCCFDSHNLGDCMRHRQQWRLYLPCSNNNNNQSL
jgi:hypothetical protein